MAKIAKKITPKKPPGKAPAKKTDGAPARKTSADRPAKKAGPKKPPSQKAAAKKPAAKAPSKPKAPKKPAKPAPAATTPKPKPPAPIDTLDAFCDALGAKGRAELATRVVELVRAEIPRSPERWNKGSLVWDENGPLCALESGQGVVRLRFFDAGATIADPGKRLTGDDPAARAIELARAADFDRIAIRRLIQAARLYNASRRGLPRA